MRFRSTLASLLALIVLSCSFAASTCEAQCDLLWRTPGCHSGSAAAASTEDQGMPAMAGMVPQAASAGRVGKALVSSAAICAQHVCVRDAALVNNDAASLAYVVPQFAAVADYADFARQIDRFERRSARGSPDLRSPSPVTLRTTLRV